MSVYFSSP